MLDGAATKNCKDTLWVSAAQRMEMTSQRKDFLATSMTLPFSGSP